LPELAPWLTITGPVQLWSLDAEFVVLVRDSIWGGRIVWRKCNIARYVEACRMRQISVSFLCMSLHLSCEHMRKIKSRTKKNISGVLEERHVNRLAIKQSGKVTRRRDLVELVLEPLSSQIDQARLQLLEKIQEVQDSTDIVARQMARQAKRGE
jgi:hypothetical protein